MKQFLMLLAAVILIAAAPAQAGEWGFAPTLNASGDFGVKAEYRWGGSRTAEMQLAAAESRTTTTTRVRSGDESATGAVDHLSTFVTVEECVAAARSGLARGYVPSDDAQKRRAKAKLAPETEIRKSAESLCFYMQAPDGWVWAYEPKGTEFWYHHGDDVPFALDACGNTVRAAFPVSGGAATVAQTTNLNITLKDERNDEGRRICPGWWLVACIGVGALLVDAAVDAIKGDDHQTTIIVNNNNGGGGVGGTINGSVGGTQNQVPGNGIGGSVGGSLSGSVDGSIGSQSGSVFGTIN